MLVIRNLRASIEDKEILKGITMAVKPGEIHAVMGPNGSGKSTLAKVLMGHPDYSVVLASQRPKVHVTMDKKNVFAMPVHERAKKGLFLAFQNPVSISGVSVRKLLRTASPNKKGIIELNKEIDAHAKYLNISKELLTRPFNEGFSGGEKKKIETLQMLFLKPKYAIIDEVDTGLDVDALRTVAQGIRTLAKKGTGVLLITHYQRILKYVKPDHVHIMIQGRLIVSGNARLAEKIEEHGYGEYEDIDKRNG